MDNLDMILSNFLNGEPIHDAIVIGILFTIFFEFYKVLASTIMAPFKR